MNLSDSQLQTTEINRLAGYTGESPAYFSSSSAKPVSSVSDLYTPYSRNTNHSREQWSNNEENTKPDSALGPSPSRNFFEFCNPSYGYRTPPLQVSVKREPADNSWSETPRNISTPQQTSFPEYSPRPSSTLDYQQINSSQQHQQSLSRAEDKSDDHQHSVYTAAAADSTTPCSTGGGAGGAGGVLYGAPPLTHGTPSAGVTANPFHHPRRGSLQLWQFLVALLDEPAASSGCIAWTGRGMEFKLVEPEEVARRWGLQKNRPAMNYDKLSRSLRYYYEKGIMQKVAGERYVYKFVCDPEALFNMAYGGGQDSSGLNPTSNQHNTKSTSFKHSPADHSHLHGHQHNVNQQQQMLSHHQHPHLQSTKSPEAHSSSYHGFYNNGGHLQIHSLQQYISTDGTHCLRTQHYYPHAYANVGT